MAWAAGMTGATTANQPSGAKHSGPRQGGEDGDHPPTPPGGARNTQTHSRQQHAEARQRLANLHPCYLNGCKPRAATASRSPRTT